MMMLTRMVWLAITLTPTPAVANTLIAKQPEASPPKASIELKNLNPLVNRWFILRVKDGKSVRTLHLENPHEEQEISQDGSELKIFNKATQAIASCSPSQDDALSALSIAKSRHSFHAICDGQLYIRLQQKSSTQLTMTEWATEALRSQSFGETLINLAKPFLVNMKAEEAQTSWKSPVRASSKATVSNGPLPARLDEKSETQEFATTHHLGVQLAGAENGMSYGQWYPSKMHEGVYVGLFTPRLVKEDILNTYKKRVNTLNAKEKNNLVYLMAYDMSQMSVEYVAGTEHPFKDSPPSTHAEAAHLTNIGSVPPYRMQQGVSVFIGGYKGQHGKIRYGPLAGRTYGLIEGGVERIPMSPDLATLYTTVDGKVHIGAWPRGKEAEILSQQVTSARQNGVLIVEDHAPTPYVNQWGQGNWSGSASGNLQTLRSSVCLQEHEDKQYLIFFAFTGATPSALARTLQAYQCKSGMHLDMNAFMYLHNAIFKLSKGGEVAVEYLHQEMEYPKGIKMHRYIMDNNPRDFFYVYRRK